MVVLVYIEIALNFIVLFHLPMVIDRDLYLLELSVVTIASLEDLGFVVNYAAADPFDRSKLASSCVCATGTAQQGHDDDSQGGRSSIALEGNGNFTAPHGGSGGGGGSSWVLRTNERLGSPRHLSVLPPPGGENGTGDDRSELLGSSNGMATVEDRVRGERLSSPQRRRRKLSASGYAEAFEYGKKILWENRARLVVTDAELLPEGVVYLGDTNVVSVLYLEEGEVYTVEVTDSSLR